jgi:peptidoglycan-N-acetylglucosamine deacetylase
MLLLASAVAAGLLSVAHTAPFAFLLEAFRRKESAWHMPTDPQSPAVYLTYDDGPNPAATPLLLDVLKREHVPATFFLIDDHLTEETAPLVQRMFAEGHAVGLHSNERWLMLKGADRIGGRLQMAAQHIEQLGGSPPCRWFRPHAGWRSATLYDALDSMDYRLAGWSFGLWDWNWWRSREAAALADRLAPRACGRHHCHSRRPSHRSARRSAVCRRFDGPVDSVVAGATDRVRNGFRVPDR